MPRGISLGRVLMSIERFMREHPVSQRLIEAKKNTPPHELLLPLYPSSKCIEQGNFNRNTLLESLDGRAYILREENPQGRAEELPFVADEYRGVGFLDKPDNGFHLRSSLEQYEFANRLLAHGISVMPPVYADASLQLVLYCQGARPLSQLWQEGNRMAFHHTELFADELQRTHQQDIVIGDRWGPNELVLPDGKHLFVDFDIEIWGPEAREFEFASLLYFTSYFAQQGEANNIDDVRASYSKILGRAKKFGIYNVPTLHRYLLRYPEYFAEEGKYHWKDRKAGIHFFRELISDA